MRFTLKIIAPLLALLAHAQVESQSLNPKFIDVFVNSGDEAALLDAIDNADRIFRQDGQRTRINVFDTGQDFEFTMPNAGSKNALPDYIGSYHIVASGVLSRYQRIRFTAVGPQAGTFRLLTIAENEMFMASFEVKGFGVMEGNGGAILLKQGGSLYANGIWFTENSAAGNGGAIYREGFGRLELLGGEFVRNTAGGSGGAVSMSGFNVAFNDLRISYLRFKENSAAQFGSAIHIDLQQSTGKEIVIRGNTFVDQKDAIGLSSLNIPTRIKNNTFKGSGAAVETSEVGKLFGNIFASEDEAPTPQATRAKPDPSPESQCLSDGGSFDSRGYNISLDDSCSLDQATDLPDTDPLLGESDERGVVPLLPNSPAIDHGATDVFTWAPGEMAVLPCGPIDVAGNARPQDANGDGLFECDSGAVETLGAGEIVAGHSAAYFNAARNGEGNYLEILDNGVAVVYTFTYRLEGDGAAWFVGSGPWRDNNIVIQELWRPVGTSFGDDFDSGEIDFEPVGQMSMVFPGCAASAEQPGNVAYSGLPVPGDVEPGFEGLISKAQRLSNIVGCGAQAPQENAGLSGSFYDPQRNGEGIIVEWLTDGRVLVIFFTFDLDGEQLWIFGTDNPDGDSVTLQALYPTTYTPWGREFDPDEITISPWGTFTITWIDCNTVTFEYDSTVPGFGSATRNYTRLSSLAGTECPDF